jgi:hypothetical protein
MPRISCGLISMGTCELPIKRLSELFRVSGAPLQRSTLQVQASKYTVAKE